jgi:hypothetical protein
VLSLDITERVGHGALPVAGGAAGTRVSIIRDAFL